jgi:hypothetical protein
MIVLVLTTPRSGSSWFTSTYLIHGSSQLTPLYPGYLHIGELFHSHDNSLIQKHQAAQFLIKGRRNCVVKLFPQYVKTVPDLYSVLTTAAEKIYILVRKDFNAQLRSVYIAEQTDHYYKEDLPLRSVQYNADDYERNKEFLQESLTMLAATWREQANAELVYLEDLPCSGKYNQPVLWDCEPPVIDFDTERLFSTV